MKRKTKTKPVKIVGVAGSGPGVYTADELRLTITRMAKQLWPTIRTDEEAEYRIADWLRQTKGLDATSIKSLPAFTVLRWLESEVPKMPVGTNVDIAVSGKFSLVYRKSISQNKKADAITKEITDGEWDAFRVKHGIRKDKRQFFYKLVQACDGGKAPKWLESWKT